MKHIDVAKKYLNQSELPGNVFDENTPIGKILHKAGQKNGEAWCSYFVEGVFREAYPEKDDHFSKIFSAGAVNTFHNFREVGYKTSTTPSVGSIVIWQRYKDGKPSWQGHAGIVIEVIDENRFRSIEGNTNRAGSREGDSVQIKERTLTHRINGLNVLGFITVIPNV